MTIIVFGSINMDLTTYAPRLPQPGETLFGHSFNTVPGGKGANQAIEAARLGAEVRMVGRVGDDDFGRTLVDKMRSEGIDMAGVASDRSNSTGVAIIMVDGAGQNLISEVYGANRASDETQLEAAKRAMEDADTLMLQLETPPHISLEAARYARSRGVRVVWDPAPAAEMPDAGFAFADFLTPNETEAAELTGVRITDEDSARAAAEALLTKGVGTAVVKMGYDGVLGATAGEHHYVLPFSVDAVDSVAAGDAFGAGLAVALSEGRGLVEALRFGAAAGALAVTKPGAQDAMPYRHEVEALLAATRGPER